MMHLERRLQHAARELREVAIDAPSFSDVGARVRRGGVAWRSSKILLPALASVLGLIVMASMFGGPSSEPGEAVELAGAEITVGQPIVESAADVETAAVAPTPSLPTAVEEVSLIQSLGGQRAASPTAVPLDIHQPGNAQ